MNTIKMDDTFILDDGETWVVKKIEPNCTQNLPYLLITSDGDRERWFSRESIMNQMKPKQYIVGDEGFFTVQGKNFKFTKFKNLETLVNMPDNIIQAWFEYTGADYEELERTSTKRYPRSKRA